MARPKRQSGALAVIPAEIRLYRNGPRTLSHPLLMPSPDVQACLDCGWAEFFIPRTWLSAGWLRQLRPQSVPSREAIVPATATAA